MIKRMIIAGVFMLTGAASSATVLADTSYAQDGSAKCGRILTFKPWYEGLVDSSCEIDGGKFDSQFKWIWTVILNLVDDMFQLAGYMAVGFVMYGGFLLMTSDGDPGKAARARKTIINAAVGIAVAILSVGLVNLIAGAIR